jgi:hypothetical protein
MWRSAGDEETAELLSSILVDEIQHVRFANRWLKQLAHEEPRTLPTIARAIHFLRGVTAALAPQNGDVNAAGVDSAATPTSACWPTSKTGAMRSSARKKLQSCCARGLRRPVPQPAAQA